eukprot:TRINITY_DN1140_c1_g1_i2.p1 TRINITY_DN1140_c1_g1~~TRINITY_DN1140_c1_g1_i2.p1  ORF type:complete len:193 (-),score=21.42 TRINITY_DN1140_c1_g1_i2:49-627(-)
MSTLVPREYGVESEMDVRPDTTETGSEAMAPVDEADRTEHIMLSKGPSMEGCDSEDNEVIWDLEERSGDLSMREVKKSYRRTLSFLQDPTTPPHMGDAGRIFELLHKIDSAPKRGDLRIVPQERKNGHRRNRSDESGNSSSEERSTSQPRAHLYVQQDLAEHSQKKSEKHTRQQDKHPRAREIGRASCRERV